MDRCHHTFTCHFYQERKFTFQGETRPLGADLAILTLRFALFPVVCARYVCPLCYLAMLMCLNTTFDFKLVAPTSRLKSLSTNASMTLKTLRDNEASLANRRRADLFFLLFVFVWTSTIFNVERQTTRAPAVDPSYK